MGQTNSRYNETVLATLEVGDLVEFPRGLYAHWGVYVGDGEMVHLAGINVSGTVVDSSTSNVFTISGIGFKKACVKKENFWNVAGKSKVKKNNDNDRNIPPLDGGEIKTRALLKIGPISYSVLWDNCEHFAMWCRYGIHHSDQAEVLEGGVTLIAFVGMLGSVLVYISRVFIKR